MWSNLAANKTLKKLCLQKVYKPNETPDDEITKRIAEVIETNNSLEELSIHPTMIGSEGRQIVLKALQKNHHTHLLRLDMGEIFALGRLYPRTYPGIKEFRAQREI